MFAEFAVTLDLYYVLDLQGAHSSWFTHNVHK